MIEKRNTLLHPPSLVSDAGRRTSDELNNVTAGSSSCSSSRTLNAADSCNTRSAQPPSSCTPPSPRPFFFEDQPVEPPNQRRTPSILLQKDEACSSVRPAIAERSS
mmetsp:Transcript_64984/g.178264  ORF Transcript_64984/g.178264 Transcript_64984/m.178264 type:complete len:106 (-) Transcript_64984:94-411(-)